MLGMAHVEAAQFTIGHDIYSCELLRLEHHHDGVAQMDLCGIGRQPGGYWIAPHHRG